MPACFEMLKKYLAFNKNFMKIKNLSKTRRRQSISGRKKTIFFLFLPIIFFLLLPVASFAQSCNGTCYSSVNCPGGSVVLSGQCSNGQVCCSGGLTNPGSAAAQSGNLATPQSSQATTMTGGGSFGNPLGVNSIEAVLGNIMAYLQGIAGTIAVIFIIIGGIMYMVSGGSKETAERAKKTLICAIAGLAIVLAAPLFYTEIKAVLSGNSPGSALQALLLNVLKLLLSIVGFLAIISMVIGAIWMLTAVGDEDRYELGKKTAGYSILGLTIALAALIIANQVKSLLGG